jgi:hypothetical protein
MTADRSARGAGARVSARASSTTLQFKKSAFCLFRLCPFYPLVSFSQLLISVSDTSARSEINNLIRTLTDCDGH